MINTSATGGYLIPSVQAPYPGGLTFKQFLQTVFVGTSGLPADLVRGKWQKNPPKQPDVDVNWLAIGLGTNKPDANAYVGIDPETQAVGYLKIRCNPSVGDTVTLNGIIITFVASGPIGDQVAIGVDSGETARNLTVFLTNSLMAELQLASYSVYLSEITVTANAFGLSGNSFTLATSTEVISISGTILEGGAVDSNVVQRHEDIEIKCSFYGIDADEIASLTRDSFFISQNLESLRLANMGFVGTNEAMRVPDLVNERWVDRYEMSVFMRRERIRTYPVLSFVSASGIIVNDAEIKPVTWSATQ